MWFARPPARASQIDGRRYCTARFVAAGRCENATFLLNKKTGRYYKLDDVGTELWTLLRNSVGMPVPEIVRELGAIYDVSPDDIATDVSALVTTLLSYQVIEPC